VTRILVAQGWLFWSPGVVAAQLRLPPAALDQPAPETGTELLRPVSAGLRRTNQISILASFQLSLFAGTLEAVSRP
jgi:hypothetical protein